MIVAIEHEKLNAMDAEIKRLRDELASARAQASAAIPEEILKHFRGWQSGERHETKAAYRSPAGHVEIHGPWCTKLFRAIDSLCKVADGEPARVNVHKGKVTYDPRGPEDPELKMVAEAMYGEFPIMKLTCGPFKEQA